MHRNEHRHSSTTVAMLANTCLLGRWKMNKVPFGVQTTITMDDAVWAPTVFTKNRDRVLNDVIAGRFFTHVRERAQPYMSDEHLHGT